MAFPYLRKTNAESRPREHLYENEVDKTIEACTKLNHVDRNKALILVAYRHALRPSEALRLVWDDVCFDNRTIQIRRMKGSRHGEHHISDKEIRYLKKLKKVSPKGCPYLFYSQRGGNLSISSFQKIFQHLGIMAGIPFKIHPHMLRHSWGYKAINNNVDIRHMQVQMGHTNINNTVLYAALESLKFEGLFKD
jgi:integrase